MSLTSEDIDAVCGLVSDLCGIYLDESKGYLIESRLADLVKREGCATYADLARQVRASGKSPLARDVIDAITTNETLFFRDASMYSALAHKVLPDVIDGKSRTATPTRIRIWSAACSTGQEPYSIAMILSEMLPDVHSWDIQILGSDISDAAINRASRGWYNDFELNRGLSPERLQRFFQQEGDGWRVKDSLRSLVCFERRSLLEPFPTLRGFDVVLCRNVAIYFTAEVRRKLFERLTQALTPTGYLFVGGQESLTDLGPRFAPHHHCRSVFYRPTMAAQHVLSP